MTAIVTVRLGQIGGGFGKERAEPSVLCMYVLPLGLIQVRSAWPKEWMGRDDRLFGPLRRCLPSSIYAHAATRVAPDSVRRAPARAQWSEHLDIIPGRRLRAA